MNENSEITVFFTE